MTPRPRAGSELRLRESQSVAPVSSFVGDIRCVAAVTSDQDCRAWTGNRNGGISVRDPDTFQPLADLPRAEDAEGFVWCLRQFGHAVWAGTSSGRLRIFDAASATLLAERRRHSGGIYAMAASNGCVYTASNDFTILEWCEESFDATGRIFAGHTNQVRCLIACASTCLVSGGDDQTLRIWHTVRGDMLSTLRFAGSVLALQHVPEEGCPLAAGYRRGALWVGDGTGAVVVHSWQDLRPAEQLPEHRGAVHALLWKHALVLSASADNTVRIWDPVNLTILETLEAHSYVFALEPVKHEAQTLFWTVSGDRTVQSWLMTRNKPAGELVDRLKIEIADLSAHSHYAEDERVRMTASQESMEAKVARLEAALDTCRHEHRATEDELRVQLRHAEDIAGHHYSKLEHAASEIDMLRQRELELQTLRPELSKQTALAAELRAQNGGLLSELSCVEGQLRAAVDKKSKLEHEIEEVAIVRQELLEAQREADDSKEKHLDLVTAIKQAELGKLSHFTFSTEVWALHRLLLETKRSTQVVAQMHPEAPMPLQQDARIALENSKRSLNHCVAIIARCFTEEEKRQCGIVWPRDSGDSADLRPGKPRVQRPFSKEPPPASTKSSASLSAASSSSRLTRVASTTGAQSPSSASTWDVSRGTAASTGAGSSVGASEPYVRTGSSTPVRLGSGTPRGGEARVRSKSSSQRTPSMRSLANPLSARF